VRISLRSQNNIATGAACTNRTVKGLALGAATAVLLSGCAALPDFAQGADQREEGENGDEDEHDAAFHFDRCFQNERIDNIAQKKAAVYAAAKVSR
jgi:hypothetical protein